MTAPALSWGLFGRGAHEARPGGTRSVPRQTRRDEPLPPAEQAAAQAGALLTALLPEPGPERLAPQQPAADRAAGPAERALLEASRELAALHPLDRLEQLEEAAAPVPVDEPAAAPPEVPWAVPPVLDVLPGAGSRGRSARDLVLPGVLLAELLAGVWLGTAKPWQGEVADPMQARFSSTAPASDDLRLPEPVRVPGAVPLPASSFLLPKSSASAEPSRDAARHVDPFQPR